MHALFLQLLCLSILLLLLLLLPFSTPSQTLNIINLGSTLSTIDDNPYWTSPSGEFSFGFYPLSEGDHYLLALWFTNIPIKTIAWTANGDHPVHKGSRVELTTIGSVSLFNSTGEEIWKAEPLDGTRAASAAMLDNGNFVLLSTDSTIKWGTFDQPTDTILPTQIVNRGGKLFSRFNQVDYSSGRFELALQIDRNLVLNTIARPTKGTYSTYWESDTINNGYQLVFDQSGDLYLTLLNGSPFNFTEQQNTASTREFYQRATIDFDGVFRKYAYPKNPDKITQKWPQNWVVSWSVPSDICTSMPVQVGSGVCGFNSYCVVDDEEQRPNCECPPGYDYLYPNDRFRGCKAAFEPQRCEANDANSTMGFEMRAMVNTDWPLCDYEHFELVKEEWCSDTCLKDCFCAVSIFREGNCWLKKFPLSNGRMDTSVGGKAFVKVSNSSPS
ncbi:hypothetical protein Scep_026957 [Stephania cephalantha]|uniref:Bulb-type lectin domain-containing protein n=1 Tax=Stephania cephalantha TaxID=152367 RepID=A0AAP0HNM5_9MAGN